MATVDFVYRYPYVGFGEIYRFGNKWLDTQLKLNGCYTYPMVFNNTIPGCRHLKINVEIENTGTGTVLGLHWDFMVCLSKGHWMDIETFIMPDTGKYTLECDINNLDITMFAFVPTVNPGSNRYWNSRFEVKEIVLTEKLELKTPLTGNFHYGVYPNYYGISKKPTEIYVNVNGVLTKATDVLVNVDGTLKSVTPVYSDHYTSESECTFLYGFTPESDGTYCIKENRISGDHELHLFDSEFNELYSGFFYERSFELTAGTLYYILVLHYWGAELSESYLQIYKEG